MKLNIRIRQGRGGRYRFFFVDEQEKTVLMGTGSHSTYNDAIKHAEFVADAEMVKEEPEVEFKKPWFSWLFRSG